MFDLIGKCKSVFVGMTVLALLTAVPVDCAIAAIIETQATQGEQNPANYRARLATLLAREEVRLALLKHGIDSTEVKLRVAALTDDEIILLSKPSKIIQQVAKLCPMVVLFSWHA